MKIRVALGLGSLNNADIVVVATHYTTCMTGNATFSAADIVAQVTATSTATTNLRNAMNAALSETKADNINLAREALDRNLLILAGKVEAVANNPSLAEEQQIATVHSAGMELKAKGSRKQRVFAVQSGSTEGSVELTASGGANAHEWQYTEDAINYGGRISLKPTTTSYVEIKNLKIGVRYAFFHRPIISGQDPDWEGPIFITVV